MIRRIGLLTISGIFLSGCALLGDTSPSFWSLIEKRGQMEPKLTDYEQGKRYLQLGSFGLAISAFQKDLAENANSISALNGLAVAYDRIGRRDVAQRYLDLALTLDPKSAVTLNNLAYLNLTQGNTALALDYGERARVAANTEAVKLPPSITTAVANNFAIVTELAMRDVREMASKEVLPDFAIDPNIERVGENEWQIHLAPAKSAEVGQTSPSSSSVSVSKNADWIAQLPLGVRVRISNGTGRNLMAARFAGYLSSHGLKGNQLANAPSFDYRQSAIYYNPDQRDFALSLSRLLPFSIRLMEANKGSGQVEIVLGSDLLTFDDELRAA